MAGAVEIVVDKRKLAQLERTLRDVPGGLPKALVGAVNDTAQATKRQMADAIYKRIAIKKRDINPHIRIRRARRADPSATVSLSETKRLSLKWFGARQPKTGVSGVSYKIERRGGWQRIPGAFISPKLGGHVFKRAGRERTPIVKLRGPSPWGVFVKADIGKQTEAESMAVLEKKLDQRVKFLLLKHSGAI